MAAPLTQIEHCPTCNAPTIRRTGVKALFDADPDGNPARKHACNPGPVATTAPNGALVCATHGTNIESAPCPACMPTDSPGELDWNAINDAMDADYRERHPEPAPEPVIARAIVRGQGQVPPIDRHYRIRRSHLDALQACIRMADEGPAQNVGLTGPAGTGKTTLGVQIAAMRQAPLFVVEAASKQTADDWYADISGLTRTDEGEKIAAEPSLFVKGIETPGAVVLINDLALLQNRTVQNGLNDLLDPSTRTLYAPALGRSVTVADGVIIVGTWNEGAEYTGATELSEQLVSRFRAGLMIELPPLSNGELASIISARSGCTASVAEGLAGIADALASDSMPIIMDTRGLVRAAQFVMHGLTPGSALAASALGHYDPDTRQRIWGIISAERGRIDAAEGTDTATQWGAPDADFVGLD